ncbi:uncharacterized protein LOC119070103 [Bradysia coprophila]|uniref:uncharacterized protein LOC119070103 n=1 Tax=Bradysia coprophila TaxID=38358 RepID=UPI00187DBE25|nr:uncharacterized protein LOC119070103 [Bradysia coprophila]
MRSLFILIQFLCSFCLSMWVIVKFEIDDDVAAVPILWISKRKGLTLCFWPNKDVEKKRRCLEIGDFSEGKKYQCKLLMNGITFKTFNKALAMEVRAQDHSSAETSDEKGKGKRKRVPKSFSSSDESVKNTKKLKKTNPPKEKLPEAVSPMYDSTDISSSEETEVPTEYSFKKSKYWRLSDKYRTFDVASNGTTCGSSVPTTLQSDASVCSESPNRFGIGRKLTTPNNVSEVTMDVDLIEPNTSPKAFVGTTRKQCSLSTTNDSLSTLQSNIVEYPLIDSESEVSDMGIDAENTKVSHPSTEIPLVGQIIDLSDPIIFNSQHNMKLADDMAIIKRNNMDLNAKLDVIISSIGGFKKAIVDLSNKVFRLEEIVARNAQLPKLSEEIKLPISTSEEYKEHLSTLSVEDTVDSVVSYLCSSNFETELEKFIKATLKAFFSIHFLYHYIAWRVEADKLAIKETVFIKCILRCIMTRFPDLKLSKADLEAKVHKCANKMKDCYRKSPDFRPK